MSGFDHFLLDAIFGTTEKISSAADDVPCAVSEIFQKAQFGAEFIKDVDSWSWDSQVAEGSNSGRAQKTVDLAKRSSSPSMRKYELVEVNGAQFARVYDHDGSLIESRLIF